MGDRARHAREFECGEYRMATSAEPGRRKAYDCDLRWRMIYQRLARGLHYKDIARNLDVSTSTVYRMYKLFETTGAVKPSPCHGRTTKKLDVHAEVYVVGLIMESPAMYLTELCQDLLNVFGIEVSPSTVCRLLRTYGFTRKKIQQVASQRCATLRGAFMAQCSLLHVDMFVWIDETGSDARNHIRKCGYALRGETPVCHRLLGRGQRTNAIAAISTRGLLTVEFTTSKVNADVFCDFVSGSLIPQVMPFNGTNPCSVALMDNLAVHHVQKVTDLFHIPSLDLRFELHIQ